MMDIMYAEKDTEEISDTVKIQLLRLLCQPHAGPGTRLDAMPNQGSVDHVMLSSKELHFKGS